jgi:transcriptional regulator with XRE-family HTH domain
MDENKFPVAQVVKKAREDQGLSVRGFAKEFDQIIMAGQNKPYSSSAFSHWENGLDEPSTDWLLLVVTVYQYQGWKREFGINCLIAKSPEVFVRDERGKLKMLVN